MAEAERRLLFLQGRARQRRRDKRELAALHQALAQQESMTTRSGGKHSTDGADGGGGGDAGRSGVDGTVRAVFQADGDVDGCLNDVAHSDGTHERGTSDALSPLDSSDSRVVNSETDLTVTSLGFASVDARRAEGVATTDHSNKPGGAGYVASPAEASPTLDDIEHDLAPTISDTSSRRALLVRMGLVRARLDSRGRDDERHRPVAESLLREVEELSKSGAVGGCVGGNTKC